MNSLSAGGAGNVATGTEAGLVFGTSVRYAGFHQDGTRRMVARPFLGITPAMEHRIEQIVEAWVAKRLLG
jgi:phage gpG-like protein